MFILFLFASQLVEEVEDDLSEKWGNDLELQTREREHNDGAIILFSKETCFILFTHTHKKCNPLLHSFFFTGKSLNSSRDDSFFILKKDKWKEMGLCVPLEVFDIHDGSCGVPIVSSI